MGSILTQCVNAPFAAMSMSVTERATPLSRRRALHQHGTDSWQSQRDTDDVLLPILR